METSESADLINKLPPLLKDNDNSPESSAEKDTIISYVESLFSHKSVDTKDVNLWNDQPAIDPNTGVTRQFEKRMVCNSFKVIIYTTNIH